jgi:hypothetical protein
MKIRHVALLGLILMLGAFRSHAQIGGLLKKPTAESILADLDGGLEFFAKAVVYLNEALLPAEQAAKIAAEIKEKKGQELTAAIKAYTPALEKTIAELIAAKAALDARQRGLVDKANSEIRKGVAKWTALGAATAIAVKNGGGDAAMVAALPLAKQAIDDLPALKRLLDATSELKKLKAK